MLYDVLQSSAERYPHNVAVRDDSQILTYEQLWHQSSELAVGLQSRGIRAGDRVCIIATNSPQSIIAQWGIYKANAICVYLNDTLKVDALRHVVEDSGASIVVRGPKVSSVELPSVPSCPVVDFEQLAESGRNTELSWSSESLSQDDSLIASIVYTSGSTGVPKGVCLTHANLVSVGKMAADGYQITSEDSYLMVVPLHYIHGLKILMAMQRNGACIQFMNNFVFPTAVTRKLEKTGVTGFSGVPYHFAALIDRGGFLEARLPALRWIGVTGGNMSLERLRQIREAKPELGIYISYGQTECSPRISLLTPDKIDRKPDSVGSVPEQLTVEFLDDNGNPVKDGDIGELVVSGPNVMHGYWNDPVNTRRVIDEHGRLHTGDLAYIDDEGDLFIKGRKQAMIKSAGERVFPEELEALLNSHPDVSDSAVVGIPDPLYGQRIEAHIVFEPSLSNNETSDELIHTVRDFCLSHVPLARAPKCFHLWEEFPLKANGKTDKSILMAMVVADAP